MSDAITARATPTDSGFRAILYRGVGRGADRKPAAVVTMDAGLLVWAAPPIPGGPAAMRAALESFRASLGADPDAVAIDLAARAIANGGAA